MQEGNSRIAAAPFRVHSGDAAISNAIRRAERGVAERWMVEAALARADVAAALIDRRATIVAVNPLWEAMAAKRGPASLGVGDDYLAHHDSCVQDDVAGNVGLLDGVGQVLRGSLERWSADHHCRRPDGSDEWLALRVARSGVGAVVSHRDVTELRRAERGPWSLSGTGGVSPGPVSLLVDVEGRVTAASGDALRVLGLDARDVVGSRLVDRMHRDDRRRAVETLHRVAAEPGRRDPLELHLRDGAGRWCVFDLSAVNLLDDPGVRAILLTGSDVTAEARRHMARSVERQLLRELPMAVIAVDARQVVAFWNGRAASMWGVSADEALGRSLEDLGVVSATAARRAEVGGAIRAHGSWEGDATTRGPDGRAVAVHVAIERVTEPAGLYSVLVATVDDITERKALQARLEAQATRDALTGLPNRVAFVQHLEDALVRSAGAAVLLVDVDDFKAVNDAVGHDHGDEVLRSIADLVGGVLGPSDVLSRPSGDELLVCREGSVTDVEAVALAERIQQVLSVPFVRGGQELQVSATVGVALATGPTHAEELLRNADVALYEAKEAGPGRVKVFDDGLRRQRRRTAAVAADLDGALRDGQVTAWYQPEVAMATGEVVGFEALARWLHPTKGLVLPDRFVPVAEETGLVNRLGAVMLRDACAALASWRGMTPTPLRMAVNVSARQLLSGGLVSSVSDALGEFSLLPGQLCIEVTESAVADNEAAPDVLRELRGLGCYIAIDDFGTGYSSLHRLRTLPLDGLKIDRSFVDAMAQREDGRPIVTLILGLSAVLGLRPVAEGVERREQAEDLVGLGCATGQGFLWSPAVPYSEATRLLLAPPWGAPG